MNDEVLTQRVGFLYACGFEKKEIVERLGVEAKDVDCILNNLLHDTKSSNGRQFCSFVAEEFAKIINILKTRL